MIYVWECKTCKVTAEVHRSIRDINVPPNSEELSENQSECQNCEYQRVVVNSNRAIRTSAFDRGITPKGRR